MYCHLFQTQMTNANVAGMLLNQDVKSYCQWHRCHDWYPFNIHLVTDVHWTDIAAGAVCVDIFSGSWTP
jgi:hypothetical protein